MEHTNPPSSTLFLPDLPADLPELELQALFQSQEGFKSARIREDRNKKYVCNKALLCPNRSHCVCSIIFCSLVGFVEFEDSNFASRARDRFNGQRPLPLPHPLTIQFARTKEPSPYGDGYRRRREGQRMYTLWFIKDYLFAFCATHTPCAYMSNTYNVL